MALKLVTAPALLVSVADTKLHLRVDSADEDAVIEGYLRAAIGWLDGWKGVLGLALKPQVWDLVYDEFPAEAIKIPLGPLISVDSVNYVDPTTEVETVWAAENYTVDTKSEPGWVVPGDNGWPEIFDCVNAVRLRFNCGHPDSGGLTTVPQPIIEAVLLLVGHWYKHREAVNVGNIVQEIPLTVRALIEPLRATGF